MGTTLDNGIYLPDEGERNCYEGLAGNWVALDNHIGSTNIHVTINDKQAWNGHVADTTIHVTSADKQAWNGKADASALTAHTGDTTIHVTAEDKAKWDVVTTKANDTDVLHKAGNETAAGIKTFSDLQIISYGTQYKGARNAYILPEFAAGYSGLSITTLSFAQTIKIGTFVLDANNKPILDTTKAYIQCATGENNSVNSCVLEPRNSTSSSLGTSFNKWKVINGISPGALFLPQDRTARVDISAYFTNTANAATNRVTPPEDGYIFLDLTDVLIVHCFSQNASNLTHYGQTFARPSAGSLYCLFPVRKNDNVAVQWYTTATDVTVSNAYFIPCKGNI